MQDNIISFSCFYHLPPHLIPFEALQLFYCFHWVTIEHIYNYFFDSIFIWRWHPKQCKHKQANEPKKKILSNNVFDDNEI